MYLISEIGDHKQVILVDTISTGSCDPGTVVTFSEKEILEQKSDLYPHGMNLPEVFALGRRLKIPLPAKINLVGIEVGEIYEFGEDLSPELQDKLEEIYSIVLRAVKELLR
ncbi:unnamed protein product [marine sediment metagenome]|uniref:Hydrogenase maturation protease n=1 Tax=marine sediment metagenome TaxID=412755 RepID=X1JRY3_9ZZZZ